MKIIINGAQGTMGQLAYEHGKALNFDVIGVDFKSSQSDILSHLNEVDAADVIIDFSHFSQLDALLDYALKNKTPLVIATTGYDQHAAEKIASAAKQIPIFKSANLSFGVHVMKKILKDYAHILDQDYDIEIIEKHHKNKVDAPSGTAYLLADAIRSSLSHDTHIITDRSHQLNKRDKKEIGIQSVRGGSIVGEHTVIFAGEDDVIEITHKAQTKMMFVKGAYKAAKFIVTQKPGLYQMDDLPFERKA
jgi:4-hydroxy-tetrahydrodipicolinate reductase